MALNALTERTAVLAAIAEYDRLGARSFLAKYGFRPAREYFLLHEGRLYDSKAIAGVAHGYQHPSLGHLQASDFSGGEETVAKALRALGFGISRHAPAQTADPSLATNRVYSWDEVGELFDFKAAYLSAAGGMVPRPDHNALLLITHPGGGKSFDYEDYWDGSDLIYTGRGKTGDQALSGANGDVAGNLKTLHVFENSGPKQLRYLGEAISVGSWPARGTGDDGNERTIHRFRLRFSSDSSARVPVERPQAHRSAAPPQRRPRAFDPNLSLEPFESTGQRTSPEEKLALQEKRAKAHRAILVALHASLVKSGWLEIEEIPAAIDLRGRHPTGHRVIFEAKSIEGNEVAQCRSALGQLLEYRFFYGTPDDRLCLVVDQAISDARVRFMESMGVGVLLTSEADLTLVGTMGSKILYPASANES